MNKFNYVIKGLGVIFLMLLLPSILMAQSMNITGQVTDSSDGMGLPGATITIDGTTNGTATDFDGNFSLTVNQGDVIIISFVGYVSQRITITTQTTLAISMETSLSQLEEMREATGSYEALFSKRATLYKQRDLKNKNLTEADYRNLILEHYTFLSRPVFILNNNIFIGNSKQNVEAVKIALNEN